MSAVTAPRPTRPARPGGPAATRDRQLRVVEEPRRRHTLAFALAILMVLGAVVFGAVALNALAAGTSVEARTLDAEVAEGERRYAQLVADVATLEDPARIRAAAGELGLVPASSIRHLAVDRNLPADGAPAPTETGTGGPDPLKSLLSLEAE